MNEWPGLPILQAVWEQNSHLCRVRTLELWSWLCYPLVWPCVVIVISPLRASVCSFVKGRVLRIRTLGGLEGGYDIVCVCSCSG